MEHHIQSKTDVLGDAIGGNLSQLISDDLSQFYPVNLFFQKMIPAKIRYETYNSKLLAIVKVFKTWKHYLEDCKYKVLIFTDHNNLQRFIDKKSLGSRQV